MKNSRAPLGFAAITGYATTTTKETRTRRVVAPTVPVTQRRRSRPFTKRWAKNADLLAAKIPIKDLGVF